MTGVPAILRIYSDDHDGAFSAEWGLPERVIPELVRWIERCRANDAMPSATAYRELAAASDHFHTDYPTQTGDPEAMAYRYVVRTGATETGWSGDLTVWRTHERPDRDPLLTVWHQTKFSSADLSSMHALALCGIQHIIRDVRSLNRPDHTAPALKEWAELASWHRTRAGAA